MLSTDPQTLLAVVAIVNAVAAGIAQIIAAIGHIQRPRQVTTSSTFDRTPVVGKTPTSN